MTDESLSRRRLMGGAGALSGALLLLARIAGAAEEAAPPTKDEAKAGSLFDNARQMNLRQLTAKSACAD